MVHLPATCFAAWAYLYHRDPTDRRGSVPRDDERPIVWLRPAHARSPVPAVSPRPHNTLSRPPTLPHRMQPDNAHGRKPATTHAPVPHRDNPTPPIRSGSPGSGRPGPATTSRNCLAAHRDCRTT